MLAAERTWQPAADPSRRGRIHLAGLALRRAIERTIRDGPTVDARAAQLSKAYRHGAANGVVLDQVGADAYAASRMPATFAAMAITSAAAAERSPGFAPSSHLDLGTGTGAAAWAVRAVWPSVRTMRLVDRQASVLALGSRLARAGHDEALAAAEWGVANVSDRHVPADVVTVAYVLGELSPDDCALAVDAAWGATRGLLVLLEPGSRAGFHRVIAARDRLLAAGGHVVAPCPGPAPCPVAASGATWCHFLARLDRSPRHRRAKAATRSWEDEPFSYVAVARPEVVADPRPRVVLGRPRHHPGRVELRICADGRIETRLVSRRAGDAWRAAKDLEWGDAITTEA